MHIERLRFVALGQHTQCTHDTAPIPGKLQNRLVRFFTFLSRPLYHIGAQMIMLINSQ